MLTLEKMLWLSAPYRHGIATPELPEPGPWRHTRHGWLDGRCVSRQHFYLQDVKWPALSYCRSIRPAANDVRHRRVFAHYLE